MDKLRGRLLKSLAALSLTVSGGSAVYNNFFQILVPNSTSKTHTFACGMASRSPSEILQLLLGVETLGVLFYKLVWLAVQCFSEKPKALAKTSSLNIGISFWVFIYVLRLLPVWM